MKKIILKGIGLAALAISIGSAQANPVTYDFTATNFASIYGNAAPPDLSLSGDVTLDGLSLLGIHLTIGAHTYDTSEVGVSPLLYGVGGKLNAVFSITAGTDDFWVDGGFDQNFPINFKNLYYSVAGINDIFYTTTGTNTVRQSNRVPEPASLAHLKSAPRWPSLIKNALEVYATHFDVKMLSYAYENALNLFTAYTKTRHGQVSRGAPSGAPTKLGTMAEQSTGKASINPAAYCAAWNDQQFKEIGDYKLSSKITIASNESKQEFDVEFLREIGKDEANVLMPKIRKILNNREIKVTFQSAETTTTKSTQIGVN